MMLAPLLQAPMPFTWRIGSLVAGELLLATLLGVLLHLLVSSVNRHLLRRDPWRVSHLLYRRLRPPASLAFPLLFVVLARVRQRFYDPDAIRLPALDHALQVIAIGVVTWLLMATVGAVAEFIKQRHRIDVADNREARRVHTQMTVIGRSVQVLLLIVGFAVALMTFPRVQQLGTSLLASAGIAGLIVGLAARPVLENLIAGVQIGLTQPVRLDDVVIVDGEWGKVEEITLTYVVLQLWDERRLILPFSKFLTQPFQNWTRERAQILGSVFLWVDYTAPIQRIREAAERLASESPLWDRRVLVVQVTDASERAIQIRVLVSAADAARSWDLRAHLRERLIDFLQRELPESLPLQRLQMQRAGTPQDGNDDLRS